MKIAIAGYGTEGVSSYAYWNTPDNQVVIIDERQPARDVPVDASVIVGEGAFSKLHGYDMVVRTAGLAPRKISTDGKIWSATNEFFAKCPASIIGVTGSKGKGTTSSLIASILRAAGHTVHLVGNIGVPALDVLGDIAADDIVVYELSSFQLWDLETSPHVAVVLMIEADHLDVHANFEEYVRAKGAIARAQSAQDVVIYSELNIHSSAIAAQSAAQKVPCPSERYAHVSGGFIWYGEQKICSVDSVRLPGLHNLENVCAAIDAAWVFTQDNIAITQGVEAFDGLPHRLKYVHTVDEVAYYDDSIATTPGSAIAAMRAFEQPKVLIMGGSRKGANFDAVAVAAVTANVKVVVLIGEEAPLIEQAMLANGVNTVNLGGEVTMADAVKTARQYGAPGDVIILSPACASFGMFKNYSDRGDQFIDAVRAL